MEKTFSVFASIATILATVVGVLAYLEYHPNFLGRCDVTGSWNISLYASPNSKSVFSSGTLTLEGVSESKYAGPYELKFNDRTVDGTFTINKKLYGMWQSENKAQGTIELSFFESCDYLHGVATRNTDNAAKHDFKWHFERSI